MTLHRFLRAPHPSICCLLVLSLAMLLTSCSSGDAARKNSSESEELIGAPPSKDQDPFASQTLPPESARAPTSGVMDIQTSEELPEDRSQTPRPALAQPASPSREHVEEAAREAASSSYAAKEMPTTETPEEVEVVTPQVPEEDVYRCFSCVRICPVSDASGDCSDSKEDMICGWGTAMNASDATKLARAQCDAALDMAREMPRFSRIDGGCPVASCME